MQKEAQKEKKAKRVADSKQKKEDQQTPALRVAHTVQDQIIDFKVNRNLISLSGYLTGQKRTLLYFSDCSMTCSIETKSQDSCGYKNT